MRSVGSGTAVIFLIAATMAIAGSLSQWVWLPLSAAVSGAEVELLSWSTATGNTFFISHGIVLAATFFVGACLAWCGFGLQAYWVLLGVFILLIYFPIRMVFMDDQWVEMYLFEAIDRSGLQLFLHSFFLPPNRGGELAFVDLREVEYILDRALAVSFFLGWGWSLALVGCLLMILIISMTDAVPLGWACVSLVGVVFIQIALLGSNDISAEIAHRNADDLLSQGDYDQALVDYEYAFRRNPSLSMSLPAAIKISKAFYQMKGESHYLSQLYLADLDHSRRRFDDALIRLRVVKPVSTGYFTGLMGSIMRTKRLVIELEAGLKQFVDGHLIQAKDHFRLALDIDPNSVRGRMYMARLLFDLQDYNRSLQILEGLLVDVYHPSFQADFHSSIGDTLNAMGQFTQAREAYLQSYDLDSKDNFRAVKGLSGT